LSVVVAWMAKSEADFEKFVAGQEAG